MEYLLTKWILNSDGTPGVTISSYKTYESALEEYELERTEILQILKSCQYNLIKLDTEEKYNDYCDNIDEYQYYVIEQTCYDVLAFYQDSGFKRPRGVSLKVINKNDQNENLNWTTDLLCYPIQHGGQW
jgi:hypothetical protein